MRALLVITAIVSIFNLASVSTHAQGVCDIRRLGYTKAECNTCSNMIWSVSRVFPRGVCVSNGTSPSGPPTAACTPTRWGGATLSLKSGNFSGTGVRISVCKNGYDLGMSNLRCSTGIPARAFNYPNTNVTCNYTTAVGGNPQVTIDGIPCCI